MTYLYIIRAGETEDANPFLKVGVSENPDKRLKTLQTSNPFELTLCMKFWCGSNASKIERLVHKELEKYASSSRGEWFRLHQATAESIVRSLVDRHTSNEYKPQLSFPSKIDAKPCILVAESAPTGVRRNPIQLLRQLPPVFETRDVRIACDWERKSAFEATARWAKQGHIKPFALGVFLNTIICPQPTRSHIAEAIERANRRPYYLIGGSALAEAGWLEQDSMRGLEVAIATDRKIRTWKEMSGIRTEPRGLAWFGSARPFALITEDGFRTLSPAFALVDAIAEGWKVTQGGHKKGGATIPPNPDEITIPECLDIGELWSQLKEAALSLKVPWEIVSEFASSIDAFRPERTVNPKLRTGKTI